MTEVENIRILLVDDHMVVRKGLFHVLDTLPDLDVIAEAESGEAALYLCQKLQPDIVIMDIKMDGMGGLEATRLIAQHHPSTRILGLSTFANQEVISEMFSAGAHGYLLKDVSAQELADAIRRIHSGEKLSPPDIQIDPTQQTSGNVSEPPVEMGLQQRKVLALMTKGFTNSEIAVQLGISQPTARYHVSAILQKLNVSNRVEAAAMAIRSSLIDENDF